VLTIQNTTEFRIERPTIVTIGTFDGVHLGHQKILQRLAELKAETGLTSVVLTFDPHPRKVLFPEQSDLKLLTTVEEKLALLRSHRVDVTVVYPFSKSFAQLDAEKYISDILVKSLKVRYLVIGYDHKFGSGRRGDIHTLKEASSRYGYEVEEISARDIDHIAISSSKIRKALEEGNLELAEEYLGHPYSISGIVVEGKKLGRRLGYPTANIHIEEGGKLIPTTGIYFVEAEVDHTVYFGMMSIGYNPTTDHDQKIKCEVNLFNFDGNLYGRQIRVDLVRRIREEKKFANLSDLKTALDEDRRQCEAWMSSAS
jgi:riboflavin kinase / FMN adenylyltransferase